MSKGLSLKHSLVPRNFSINSKMNNVIIVTHLYPELKIAVKIIKLFLPFFFSLFIMDIKHYDNANKFLSEVGDFLHTQEITNSIFIDTLKLEIQKGNTTATYCGAVWDTNKNQFVFALFGIKRFYVYASGISSSIDQERYGSIVELLVMDLLSSSFPFTALQGFQPVLGILKNTVVEHQPHFKFNYTGDVWSYDIEQVQWSPHSLSLKSSGGGNTTELRQATQQEQALVTHWAQDYFKDLVFFNGLDIDTICQQEFEQKNIYILYVDGTPVSLTWKRRALRDSVSIAYVYTPKEYRGKGYAEVCVSMATELFLKEYRIITLNSIAGDDPTKNLYARLGYRLFGKAGRYTLDT
jgi:RimJ/RimL family protein N-acetyltransferase